jgi:UDP-N-acetylmuramoyl-L-alanyl-D-glutamate--2,6-diaminopimelate ligase
VLIIAGKGHETYQIVGNVKHDFDDSQVARDVALALESEAS